MPPRRYEDIEKLALLGGLLALVLSGGIAWGAASAAVSQKVDRSDFNTYVADMKGRLASDSVRSVYRDRQLERIEAKVDSTNLRLQRYLCRGQPLYCQ